jgi:hypothetical protein
MRLVTTDQEIAVVIARKYSALGFFVTKITRGAGEVPVCRSRRRVPDRVGRSLWLQLCGDSQGAVQEFDISVPVQ